MQGAIGKVKAVRVVDRSVEVEWGVIRVVRSKSWAAVMHRIVCVDLWTSVGDVKIKHDPDLSVEVKGKVFHKRIFFSQKVSFFEIELVIVEVKNNVYYL